MRWAHMTYLKTATNLQLNIKVKKFGTGAFRINTEIWILKQQVQETINKGVIILGQVTDKLIKIKQ